MVGEWGLYEWQHEILARWNDINLYSLTRGVNRFKGLLMALREINEKYVKIEDLDSLANWVEATSELSNNSLARAIEENPDSICRDFLLHLTFLDQLDEVGDKSFGMVAKADVGYCFDAIEGVCGANGNVGELQHRQVVLVVATSVKLDGLACFIFNVLAESGEHGRLGGVRRLEFEIRRARFARFEAIGPGLFGKDAERIKSCLVAADNYLVPILDGSPFLFGKVEDLCGRNSLKIVIDRGATLALTG